MSEDDSGGAPASPAEALFIEYLAGLRQGTALEIEELCRLHPGHAAEFHAIQADAERLKRLDRTAREYAGGVTQSLVRQASRDGEERFARAEELLERFFEQNAEASRGAQAFELFVSEHRELERELRKLHSACAEVQGVLVEGNRLFEEQQKRVAALLATVTSSEDFERRYRIEGELGRGGMGAVLRVVDGKLERPLAMKVILGQQSGSTATGASPPVAPRVLRRFLNEARITSQLDHPGIVPVHELGVDSQGRAFFTMKLVRGRTLSEVFRLQAEGAPGWSQVRVLALFQRLCDALAFAHEHGVIHRDLKPANVMVGDFGEVYVMDWGLARRLTAQEEPEVFAPEEGEEDPLARELTLTRQGAVVGTPAYMSPEQASGRIEAMGPPADVYAVGALLYQLIVGHAPYCEPNARSGASDVLVRIAQGPPRALDARQAPPELVAITQRAMEREPARRYPDVRALAADLDAFLEGRVVRAYEAGAWAEAKKWVQRNRAFAGAVAAVFVCLVLGIVAVSQQKRRADAQTREVLRLAALRDARARIEKIETLWPAQPALRSALEAWVAGVEAHVAELPRHRARLAELAARGTARQVSGETESSRERVAALTREIQARERALHRRNGLREVRGDPLPDVASYTEEARDLNERAWGYVNPESVQYGRELLALALVEKALADAPKASRFMFEDTHAWALFALGRDDEALAASSHAIDSAPDEKRAEFEQYWRKLEQRIMEATSQEALEREGTAIEHLRTELGRVQDQSSARVDVVFPEEEVELAWLHREQNQLVELVERLEVELHSTDPAGIPSRITLARKLEQGFARDGEFDRAWRAAAAELATTYPGLDLPVQMGLVPIGKDPRSGLFEFADLTTGRVPERNANGELVLSEENCLVFVLLPGGNDYLGAHTLPDWPNHDATARPDEFPPHRVQLSPFFLSKFEMTQGQWLRITTKNPSQYAPGDARSGGWFASGRPIDLEHPVEGVSWHECVEVMRRLGMELPSEAQWEYACRAGTDEPNWTGQPDLSAIANVADQFAKGRVNQPSWTYENWKDGATVHERVGVYEPNPLGLHDMLGNVFEWCADGYHHDAYARHDLVDPRMPTSSEELYVRRGGSFALPAAQARASARAYLGGRATHSEMGVRPARALDRAR